jgi:hypothetical protein
MHVLQCRDSVWASAGVLVAADTEFLNRGVVGAFGPGTAPEWLLTPFVPLNGAPKVLGPSTLD